MFAPCRAAGVSALAASLVLLTGCAKEPVYHPVAGKLSINEKSMTFGRVVFVPDVEKGNTSPEEARGRVDPKTGMYSLTSGEKTGCRPGWYKVVVFAFAEPGPGEGPKPPVWVANQKYGDPKSTDLTVEVTADGPPERYNFDLKP